MDMENKTCCTTPESFMHPIKSKPENHISLTSLPVNEAYLESTEHFLGYGSKSHSHTDNKLTCVLDKVDFLTKSLDCDRHVGSFFSPDDINVRDESPCTVETPASESFHPLFPDSFHDSATPVVSSSLSKFSRTSVGDNHKHAGGVSQSH